MIGWKPKSDDARVASVRIRCLNPLRELQRRGRPVELFRPERSAGYSAVIYSKLYDDASYREAARLQAAGARIIVDLCDNHFYNPEGAPELRRAGSDLRRMLRLADHVVVSTPELAGVVQREVDTGHPLSVIGDAVEESIVGVKQSAFRNWQDRRRLRRLLSWLERGQNNGTQASFVWFGIHGGPHHEHGMADLLRVREALESLHRVHSLQLTVISNSRQKFDRLVQSWSLPTRYLEWSAVSFFAALRAHDIALIPVTPNPFTWSKSNNRLATALAAGLAVIADPVPSYLPFSEACRLDQWQTGLEEYVTRKDIRRKDVRAGQELVGRHCSLDRIADAWQELLLNLEPSPALSGRLEARSSQAIPSGGSTGA